LAAKRITPGDLARKADDYYLARMERLALQKQVDKLEKKEKELRAFLIDNLPKSQVGGVSGKVAQVEVSKKDEPVLKDPKAFFAYARKTKQLDLIVESMNKKAVKDRWAAGTKNLPGVDKFSVVGLSVHKVKQKRN
jgi:hypothetical protein